jgi:LysR family transcriptional regulator, transcription activator of glutamate synthase operon
MELRQLRYFVAVARHGNFTRAARGLQLAQPALSQQIRRLERELEVELFVRSSRGVRPTDAGQILLRRATRIDAELEGLRAELAQLSGALRGHVRLGVTVMPRHFELPALLAEFRRERPGVDVLLRSGTAETMARMLDADELDVAFATVTNEPLPHGTASQILFREDIVALLPREHALATGPEVALSALAAEDLIAAEPGAAVREMIDRALIAEGLAIRIPFETHDPDMVRSLAASRLGVAIAPRAMVEPADPGFVVLPVNPPRLVRDVALLWREDRPYSPAVEALKAFVFEHRLPPQS